jgi:GT2 family glycosyltransferase
MQAPAASIVIPTRGRPAYLEVALASIAEQSRSAGAEIVVVDDAGETAATRAIAARHGARYEPHDRPRGLNAARNTGVARSAGELVIFLDDDIRAEAGWLQALLRATDEHPGVDVFAGRIRARLEGRAPRGCGRENASITTLDLGPDDTEARFAWGANMGLRRSALQHVGPFDPSLADGGDEQEWQERLRRVEPGARTLYVARAAVEHRRTGRDAQLRALAAGARTRGRAARRFDARRGGPPPLGAELGTLGRCAAHVVRRRCPAGLTMVAHSFGRVEQAFSEGRRERHSDHGNGDVSRNGSTGDDFLSGASGTVGGFDAIRRRGLDLALDAADVADGRRLRLARASRESPPRRRVLVLSIVRPAYGGLAAAAQVELERSRHDVELRTKEPEGHGRFENLNMLLGQTPAPDADWLLFVDDDIRLPHGFLDRFIFLSERFGLALAQPAHRLASHAAWQVTRRRRRSVVRETVFVEIGPVTAFARETFPVLLPFPELRMGWGLDAHWAAVARGQGWRCGVVDAVPILHSAAPAASTYDRNAAIAEARRFLADRSYVPASDAQRTLATHRKW